MFKYISPSYLFNLIKANKWEVFLSICLFSNLYPDLPRFLYYLLWLAFIFAISKMKTKNAGQRSKLAYGLIVIIIFSTIINVAIFDYRWIMMCIILFITLCKTSYRFFIFKERFLFISLFGYAFTGLLNNYAHIKNINYQLYSWSHAGQEFTIDFSGFTCHPMWLSATCGIGLIFFAYWMNSLWNKGKKIYALLMLPLMFLTVQTLVWGGSRSALGISIVSSLLLVWLSNKNIGKTFVILGTFAIMASIITPIILGDSERMQTKQGGFNLVDENGNNSRTALWNARINEFSTSPIWGIGFGVTGTGDNAKSGRAETGSGWLTVLSQTGLVGFILSVLLLKRAILPLKFLRNNPKMALYTALLAFMSLHTLFEAYIFQSGWYLCFVFWLTISILDDYRKYYKIMSI